MALESIQPLTQALRSRDSLIRAVLENFREHFAPQSRVVFVSGTRNDQDSGNGNALAELGISAVAEVELPDVILVDPEARRLFLIETAISHGSVSPLRRRQLAEIFGASKLGIIYVTAFESRAAFTPYVSDISWETEVWLADAPMHLIHFDGERFLGPYESPQNWV